MWCRVRFAAAGDRLLVHLNSSFSTVYPGDPQATPESSNVFMVFCKEAETLEFEAWRMNFRSGGSSGATRPIEAMIWINEVLSAKSIVELKRQIQSTGQSCRQLSRFSTKASGLKNIINGNFKSRDFEEAGEKETRILTGGQVALMIYECFKVSDTDESALYLPEILTVHVKNHDVQSFNTRWDGTLIAMKNQPDDAN